MEKDTLEALLAEVITSGASTLHLSAGHRPAVRANGQLSRKTDDVVTSVGLEQLSREFLFADHREMLLAGRDVEILYASSDGTRFRTLVARQSQGLSMAFHRIPTRVPDFDELRLPPVLGGFTQLSSGLVVVTGFLASGKSTTLAAMVNHINRERAQHVVMIEDPIEFIHHSVSSLVHQREVGFHVPSFAEGVREACRAGADVIAVSEVRDSETMDAILDATEKGVLVFATLRASSAGSALAELQGFYAQEERVRMRARLAVLLRVLLAQSLLNGAGGGKVPLVEIMVNSSVISRLIQAGAYKDLAAAMVKSRGLGSQTADLALRDLLKRELITADEALFHATDRDMVMSSRGRVWAG